MQPADNDFFEEYKRLDRLCADMYSCQNGVSEYINQMENNTNIKAVNRIMISALSENLIYELFMHTKLQLQKPKPPKSEPACSQGEKPAMNSHSNYTCICGNFLTYTTSSSLTIKKISVIMIVSYDTRHGAVNGCEQLL